MMLAIALRLLAVTSLLFCIMPLPATAQLLSEQIRDASRICSYAGTETMPDGQIVPRTFVTGLGQECPASAPNRDPNAPVPPNATLTGEQTAAGDRVCIYSEGGIDYQVRVSIDLRCAMTPALLEQAEVSSARQNAR